MDYSSLVSTGYADPSGAMATPALKAGLAYALAQAGQGRPGDAAWADQMAFDASHPGLAQLGQQRAAYSATMGPVGLQQPSISAVGPHYDVIVGPGTTTQGTLGGAGGQGTVTASASMSTTTKVAIGVGGAAALALVAYLVLR